MATQISREICDVMQKRSIDRAVRGLSETFGQEIAKLQSEISKLKSSHSLSVQTADKIRLDTDNRDLRQKAS